MRNTYIICLLMLNTICAHAQTVADTSKERMSPLKTMPYEQYKAYINGEDMNNLAAVAELNHFPSSQKVLELKKELGLTASQLAAVTAINTELKRKMKEMGEIIIKNETTIDKLFRTKQLDDGTLIFYINRYGLYQGELRNAILQTYIKTAALLTPAQQKRYVQLQKP